MISAIIPARNEEDRVPATLAGLARVPGIEEILVIDDGSTDATASRADEAGATVLRLTTGVGKGGALQLGAEATQGEVLLLLDADIGETAEQASALLAPVIAGEADMTTALFPTCGRGASAGGFGFVVRLARWGIRRATGREMGSPLSGQRALRRDVWERIGGFEGGFGAEVGLTIDALRAGYDVVEVPVTMTHRVTGRDVGSMLHRGRQLLAVARALWKRRASLLSGPPADCPPSTPREPA